MLHGDVVHIGHVWTLDQGECWTMTSGWSSDVDNDRGVITEVQVSGDFGEHGPRLH